MNYSDIKTLGEFRDFLKGKSVSVVGIGISNIPLLKFLCECGAKKISARDKKDIFADGKIPELSQLEEKIAISYILGDDYLKGLNEDIIFKTPGIRRDLPEFVEAQNSGSVITSEMELFFMLCPATTIAVTGSAGKTTTTTIIGEILKASGKNVFVGGNIGEPLLCDIENIKKEDFAVLELSSFQLFDLDNGKFAPNIAVFTNITPNHLDWHRDMCEYIAAKKIIYKNQKESDKLILSHDDELMQRIAKEAKSKICFFSGDILPECHKNGVYFDGDDIFVRDNGEQKKMIKKSDIKIRGEYNILNFMAAIAATHEIANAKAVLSVAKTFGGVEHRMEFVGEIGGVLYYNSSIDSTPTRTLAALNYFEQDKKIIAILGGSDKNIDFEPLVPTIYIKAKAAVLYGATKEKINKCLEAHKKDDFAIYISDSFDLAAKKAKELAEPGDIVLLSPACASFDCFKNFEERGERFKEIVRGF